MRWLIHYDVAALIVCVIIYFVLVHYKRFPTWQNSVYKYLLLTSISAIVFSLISVYISSLEESRYIVYSYILNQIYLLLFNLIPVLYFLFILGTAKGKSNITLKHRLLIVVPYTVSVSQILLTPLTKFIMRINQKNQYFQGPGMKLLYGISLFYLLLSFIITIKYHKNLTRMQKGAVVFYTLSSISVVILQFFLPQYLMTGFAISMSLFFIYLTLQNPLEFKDTVTDAFNREAFMKMASEYLEGHNPFQIFGLQIDGLQFINEKFGVENGDNLLRQITNELLLQWEKKEWVFRLAGSQFLVLAEMDFSAEEWIEKITNRFEHPFVLNGVEVSLRVYLCCLQYPEHVKTLSDIMDLMEFSVREAKQLKKNGIVYGSEALLREKRRENAVEQAIERAIATESFEVYYQPIYSVKKKCYTGAEALVRLKDKELGFISPDEFIPMAERNGRILKVGEIVFRKVCEMIQREKICGLPVECIHVNLSVVQCMQEELAEDLCRIMDQYEIPYSMINFEITETSAVNSGEHLMANMERLKKKGIHFSLDDYGTGYSNTANLMEYEYAIVKLDKSIVWAATESRKALVTLKYMIALIRELNMGILAEGIETEEQGKMLEELKCEFFQGYYYSKPLPEQQYLELIRSELPETTKISC